MTCCQRERMSRSKLGAPYLASLLAAVLTSGLVGLCPQSVSAQGPGLPTDTWAAGSHLGTMNRGGRINTFHRGYLYLGAQSTTSVWDISDPGSPLQLEHLAVGVNGHTWLKIGDLFWRQYWIPEHGDASPPQFQDLTDMLARTPWTTQDQSFDVLTNQWNFLRHFPLLIGGSGLWDIRDGTHLTTEDIRFSAGINATERWRLGNLLFMTPGDEQSGVALWDVGDPTQPVLRDVLTGTFFQYTTAWQLWRHYLVLMIAEDINGPDGDANFVVIDFSDPDDLQVVADYPTNVIPGRYMHFQDQYGFSGRAQRGVKVDMEAVLLGAVDPVILEFTPPPGGIFEDFQWLPLGHMVLMSQSQTNSSHSYLFSHLDHALDTTPPSVGYHLPEAGAVQQPETTVVGLVINETLDDTTIHDATITLAPVGGSPVSGTVISSQYDVINFVPDQPLLADTTYQVTLVADGIHDVAGNGIDQYSFLFSTGDTVAGDTEPEITEVLLSPPGPVESGTLVEVTTTAEDLDGDGLEYRWDFGDGSAQTPWGVLNSVDHLYSQPGNYTIQAQVRDDDLNLDTMTRNLVVYEPSVGLAPTRSTPIAVDEATRTVWVTNPDHDTVSSFHADSLDGLAEHVACAHPASLALDGIGQVWVACRGDDRLVVLDAATGSLIESLSLDWGAAPVAIAPSPDRTELFVAESGTQRVVRYDAASRTATGTTALDARPGALAVPGDSGELLVSRFVSGPGGGTVWRLPLPSMGPAETVVLPPDVSTADSGTAGRGDANYLGTLAVHPAGGRAYVGAKKDNIYRGRWVEDTDLDHETTVRSMVTHVALDSGLELVDERVDIDDRSLPTAVVPSALGNHLFVTFMTNRRIVALDAWTGAEAAGADTGLGSRGVAVDSLSGRIYTADLLDRAVSVFDGAALSTEHQLVLPHIATVPVTTFEPLSPDVLLGKRVFHDADDPRMSQDSYMACASCHLEGRQDGRVWDFTQFGEGLRNTTSLRGVAGMSHGPVHWSGNFDEIQDFETPIRDHFGGTGFIPNPVYHSGTVSQPLGDPKSGLSTDLDALAAYLESLVEFDRSPHRTADGSLTAAGSRGRTVFRDQGCVFCHRGADFSDSDLGLRHDVGTQTAASGQRLGGPLDGLDTPTLRGVWQSAPYFHDGSADSLEAVLSSGSGIHRVEEDLTPDELADLLAFVRQIDGDEPEVLPPAEIFSDGFESGDTSAW